MPVALISDALMFGHVSHITVVWLPSRVPMTLFPLFPCSLVHQFHRLPSPFVVQWQSGGGRLRRRPATAVFCLLVLGRVLVGPARWINGSNEPCIR